jgi:hypothetical protein
MRALPTTFSSELLEGIVRLLWNQWSELGVSGDGKFRNNQVIDPEAMLCATCLFARYEPRLFDEVADWLRANGWLINISRLKRISRLPGLNHPTVLAALAGHLQTLAGSQKWKSLAGKGSSGIPPAPFFIPKPGHDPMPSFGPEDPIFTAQGWSRGPLRFSRKSKSAHGDGDGKLLLRLRALFGVTARCEILAYLLDKPGAHPHEVARQTHYFVKTAQDALVQMRQSGLVTVRSEAGKKIYSMEKEDWQSLLRPQGGFPRYLDWAEVLSCLATLWEIVAGLATDESPDYVAARLKEWCREAKPKLEAAGLVGVLRDAEPFSGQAYLAVFLEDMRRWIL